MTVRWRVGVASAVALCAMVPTGCSILDSDSGDGAAPQPSSPGSAAPPSQRQTTAAADVRADLVQKSWTLQDLDALPRWSPAIPAQVQPEDALSEPSLLDDPLPRAVLVIRDDLFAEENAWPDGEFAVLGSNGEWRRLFREDLHLRSVQHDELSFSVSADGSQLAVADKGAVVVVEVATGEFERFPVPFREPIGLEWTPGNTHLLTSDRFARTERALLLDLRDGTKAPVPYSIFGSDFAPDGTPVELRVLPGRRGENGRLVEKDRGKAVLRLYSGPTQFSSAPTQFSPTPVKTGGIKLAAIAAGRVVALERQPASKQSFPSGQGALVVDSDTGEPLGLLPIERMSWIELVGWIDPQTLLIGDGSEAGRGGYLLAWNWVSGELRVVTRFVPGGVAYSVATQLLR